MAEPTKIESPSSWVVKTGDGKIHLVYADSWEFSGNGLTFKSKSRTIAWFLGVEWFREQMYD